MNRSVRKNWLAVALYIPMLVLCTSVCFAAVYEVGPGYPYEDLNSIDWPNLAGGDEVHIYWRSEPYRSKIGIRTRASAQAPLRIIGIPGPQGERPVITGESATTPPSLNNFFDTGDWSTEVIGVITIIRSTNDPWEHKPAYIEIEGLHIQGGHPDSQFTGANGQTQTFNVGAAGIHANVVEHLTVRDCEISDNANGFFVLSRGDEETMSRDILFENNYVYNNGVIGSDQEHNIYTQASNITFQYNRIEALRSGARGIALKDRSAGTVIRYNWVVSGARTLDLVEPEDSWQIMLNEPGFGNTWIYGNVFINEYSSDRPYALNMFHYGGDMGETFNYRKGVLHFYHNTVYIRMSRPEEWDVTLFDLSTNEETVNLYNNVFYRDGDVALYFGRDAGIHRLYSRNWISDGWLPSAPENEWHNFVGEISLEGSLIEGESPGFANAPSLDFSISQNAAIKDVAADLPANLTASHPVNMQYQIHQGVQSRDLEGVAMDLGAFEGGNGGGNDEPVDTLDPQVQIFLNGNNNDVEAQSVDDTFTLEVSLDAGDKVGEEADWWLIINTESSWMSFTLTDGLSTSFRPIYQGPLVDLPVVEIIRATGIPPGSYTFYFGVDTQRNGEIDTPIFYSSSTLEVSSE